MMVKRITNYQFETGNEQQSCVWLYFVNSPPPRHSYYTDFVSLHVT